MIKSLKYIALIILLTQLSNCAFDQTIEYRVDSDLLKYVNGFYTEASIRGITLQKTNLDIYLDSANKKVNVFDPGISFRIGHQKIVAIDYFFLTHSDSISNEIVIYHELGHSLLGLPHSSDKKSLMYSTGTSYLYYKLNKAEILDNLFNH